MKETIMAKEPQIIQPVSGCMPTADAYPAAAAAERRSAPAVITVAVTKGGVAKTTAAVNLAAEMGLHGAQTLLVDMDEQGNTTLSATGKNREAFNNAALFDAYRTFGFQ